MPELPEVETCLRGLKPHVTGQTIEKIIIREHRLRWPIPKSLARNLQGQTINAIERRGKYLLFTTTKGTLIIHLGMSGSLRLCTNTILKKHDHVDIHFNNDYLLRYHDPRRFGSILWTQKDPAIHPLLSHLGVEPLTTQCNGHYLFENARKKKCSIKLFIMDSSIMVGVGNIYANEALFMAKIDPRRAASDLTKSEFTALVHEIKKVLRYAIKQGGTTLRDYVNSEGNPGYFKLKLQVYGRGNKPCIKCTTPLTEIRLGQRSTVFCPHCQQ